MATIADRIHSSLYPLSRVRTSVAVYGLLLLATAALWPSAVALERNWREITDYDHGYLIAVVVVVWLAKLRPQIDAAAVRPPRLTLPLLFMTCWAWLVALRGSSDLLLELLFPLVVWTTVWAAAGSRIALLTALPLSYLYFAIPVWDYLVPLLKRLATFAAEGALGLLGVPTTVAGTNVTIPAGTFAIVEGCSGKRYLVIALATALLIGLTQKLQMARLALLLVCAALLAIVANWLRIVTIIYAGHITDMQHYLVSKEHVSFGWFVFGCLLLAVVYIAGRFSHTAAVPHAFSGKPPGDETPRSVAWLAPAVALLSFAVIARIPISRAADEPFLSPMPVTTGEWQGPLPPRAIWTPYFAAADVERRASYAAGGVNIEVYVNVYGWQEPGRELVFYKNLIVPQDWSGLAGFAGKLGGSAGNRPALMTAHDNLGQRWIIARIYNVDGFITTRSVSAQLLYGLTAMLHSAPSGVVAFATPCADDCDHAALRVIDFWQDQGQHLAGLIAPLRRKS